MDNNSFARDKKVYKQEQCCNGHVHGRSGPAVVLRLAGSSRVTQGLR